MKMAEDYDEEELLDRTQDADEPLASNPLWNDVEPLTQNDGIQTGE